MPLTAGARLGPYQVVAPLGAGGMGEVYRARDTRLDRTVAIKVLPAHLADRPDLRERFEREARSASSLNHPNICVLHDIGSENGVDFLVMEFLEGMTLADRLGRSNRPLAFTDALTIAIQMADALDTAHRSGIVHRDLKPGNIFLAHSSGSSGPTIAKLLDFGLAKTSRPVAGAGRQADPSMAPTVAPLTVEGTILGTLQYMVSHARPFHFSQHRDRHRLAVLVSRQSFRGVLRRREAPENRHLWQSSANSVRCADRNGGRLESRRRDCLRAHINGPAVPGFRFRGQACSGHRSRRITSRDGPQRSVFSAGRQALPLSGGQQ